MKACVARKIPLVVGTTGLSDATRSELEKAGAVVPVLAARFASAVLIAPGLTDERRSALIQQLAPLAITNRTALDTVLARLLLSARNQQFEMPKLLAGLNLPMPAARATGSESMIA